MLRCTQPAATSAGQIHHGRMRRLYPKRAKAYPRRES
jgi:hypothetical protein